MTAEKPQPADWVQDLIRDFQDQLTCGLYDAIYQLGEPAVETLMRAQARTCVTAFLGLGLLRAPLPLEEFLQAMRTAGPSPVEIERDGDVIHWTERHRGECACPFVRRGVVRLDATLCRCGAHWVQRLFEVAAKTRVEVETVETVADGASDCRFRIRVLGPA